MKKKRLLIYCLFLLAFLTGAAADALGIVGWLQYQPYKLRVINLPAQCQLYWEPLEGAWVVINATGIPEYQSQSQTRAMYYLAVTCPSGETP